MLFRWYHIPIYWLWGQ